MNQIRDKISGCIFGGALGDALGYAVEFFPYENILKRYGHAGIRDLELCEDKAIVSDDTQMTLFTMEGMIQGYRRGVEAGIQESVEHYVYYSYLRWLETQDMEATFDFPDWPSRLKNVPEMNAQRAPGNTCLFALESGIMGTIQNPINKSKGCGGVMRTAPLGFSEKFGLPLVKGACVAAITHGHPLGWIPAGMLSDIVYKCIYGEENNLKAIIEASLADTVETFQEYEDIAYFEELIKKAMILAEEPGEDESHIRSLGEGWIGEEALAIAIYACLRHPTDIKEMLRASVNHSGDSDSTGAIAGNILGAYLGMEAVPKDWLADLELVDEIQRLTEEMMEIVLA